MRARCCRACILPEKRIEQNLPSHRVRFLAYPGGANSSLNDRTVAAKYYAGVRGATGTLVSPALIDYLCTRAIGLLFDPASKRGIVLFQT